MPPNRIFLKRANDQIFVICFKSSKNIVRVCVKRKMMLCFFVLKGLKKLLSLMMKSIKLLISIKLYAHSMHLEYPICYLEMNNEMFVLAYSKITIAI